MDRRDLEHNIAQLTPKELEAITRMAWEYFCANKTVGATRPKIEYLYEAAEMLFTAQELLIHCQTKPKPTAQVAQLPPLSWPPQDATWFRDTRIPPQD